MEPESSLPYSQAPASCPYPEPTPSSPHNPSHFLKIHLNIILHLRLGLPNGLFSSGFPTKTLYTPLPSSTRATCPAHLIIIIIIIFYVTKIFQIVWAYVQIIAFFRPTSRYFYLRILDHRYSPSRSRYCHFYWIRLLLTFLLPTKFHTRIQRPVVI